MRIERQIPDNQFLVFEWNPANPEWVFGIDLDGTTWEKWNLGEGATRDYFENLANRIQDDFTN